MALFCLSPKAITLLPLLFSLLIPVVQGITLIDFEQCRAAVNASYSSNPSIDYLRDQHGKPTNNISIAWGISYPACKELCTAGTGFIDWNFFSTQFTTWLLPWLALTAQLPFQTKNGARNLQALFLAIGCPLLIIYSLTLTNLTARTINQNFRQIKDDLKKLPLQIRGGLLEVIDNFRTILIESQHVPLQVINGPDREISQLLVNPENASWSSRVANDILKTKREWNYPLTAQLSMVVIAQIFSIIDYFTSTDDAATISVGLALNTLWIWMIPVTLGWVFVGTQSSAGSIEKALSDAVVPKLGIVANTSGRPIGFADRTRYTPSRGRNQGLSETIRAYREAHYSAQINAESEDTREHPNGNHELRGLLGGRDEEARTGLETEDNSRLQGFVFAADDTEPGPIFNYARVWSYMNIVAQIVESFRWLILRQELGETVSGQEWDPLATNHHSNLLGSPSQMSRYISPPDTDNENFTVHSNQLPGLKSNCLKAGFTAVVLFWCTAGAGIFMAYATPTVGLGCNSGGYLLYAVLATCSWLLLLYSAYLSHLHAANLETGDPNRFWYLPVAAFTCYCGKFIAGFNALWLFCASIFQFTNLYNTCWCSTSIISLRGNAWLALLESDAQIASTSKASWIGGVFLASAMSAIAAAFFLRSRGDEIYEGNKK